MLFEIGKNSLTICLKLELEPYRVSSNLKIFSVTQGQNNHFVGLGQLLFVKKIKHKCKSCRFAQCINKWISIFQTIFVKNFHQKFSKKKIAKKKKVNTNQ